MPSIPSPPTPVETQSWTVTTHIWALRFSLHLALISLFETIFFWHFVSVSEDHALMDLINGYTVNLLRDCGTLTPIQRSAFDSILGLFINQTTVDQQGAVAAATRATFNTVLLRNSWLLVGGLTALVVALAAGAKRRALEVPWGHVASENLALVTLLGLYEWMFFRTVIFPYKSVSIPELDRMVVDEVNTAC